MKPGTHPTYAPVAFRDRSTGSILVTRSTLAESLVERVEIDGRSLPLVDVDITSDSHPFWTGTQRTLDSEGRVEAFHRRYGGGR